MFVWRPPLRELGGEQGFRFGKHGFRGLRWELAFSLSDLTHKDAPDMAGTLVVETEVRFFFHHGEGVAEF